MKEKPLAPYREAKAPPKSIEEMEEEIAKEGAVGIRLPDALEYNQKIDLANIAIGLKVKLERALLYSPQWGILRFHKRKSFADYINRPLPKNKDDIFIFKNDSGQKVAFIFNRDTKKFTFWNDNLNSNAFSGDSD